VHELLGEMLDRADVVALQVILDVFVPNLEVWRKAIFFLKIFIYALE